MQVDFYILENKPNFTKSVPFVCSLVEKAYLSGHTLVLQTGDADLQSCLDEALWTYRDESFIPHQKSNQLSPFCVTVGNLHQTTASILLNLTHCNQPLDANWQRLLQIVPNDPDMLTTARTQFRHYQALGHSVNSHKIKS